MPSTRREALRRLGLFVPAAPLAHSTRSPKVEDRFPSLTELETAGSFEQVAKAKISRTAYDYVAGGVDGEFSLHRNRQAYQWVSLVPKAVGPVAAVDLSLELAGQSFACPIMIAPTATHQQLHSEGELATYRGAAAAKACYVVSSNSSYPIDQIAKAADGSLWFQLYARDTPDGTQERVERAVGAGCRAVMFTVDVQYLSHRERMLHDRNLNIAAPGVPARRPQRGGGPPAHPYRLRPQNPNLDWAVVEAVRSYAKVPLLLKGILTAEDARLAAERGVNGIVVSNHGGRYLDYTPSPLEVLPEIVAGVGGRIPILMDGGIMSGIDVFKALALGAKAALVGRAPLWGLGAFGAAGVERVLEILKAELVQAMKLTGCPGMASINSSVVKVDFA